MSYSSRQAVKRKITGILTGFIALVFLSGAVAPAIAAAQPTPQTILQRYADDLHEAGVTGVLMHAELDTYGSQQARAGVSNRHLSLPVSWNAHFRTASTTKTFVATVVLQLVAEGKISLDDSLEKWLPGILAGTEYNASAITVRQLLNHTSGIFDYTNDEAFFATLDTPQSFYANRFRSYTPQELIAIAKAHPPTSNPGVQWNYSNTNYVIIGEIIRAATGKSWEKEVRERILRPLGLHETTAPGSNPFMPLPFVTGYHIYTSDPEGREYTNTTLHNPSWGGAAGGLITTTKDQNRFLKALMKGQLLPPAQLAEMKTTVPIIPGYAYGLGIIWTASPCAEKGIWGHDGGAVGYATSNGVTDDGSRSVVASLATTTFTDLSFVEATAPLRSQVVADTLCYGKTLDKSESLPAPNELPGYHVRF